MMIRGSLTRFDQRGFTLTELLVALAGVGLVLAGVATLQITGTASYVTGANQVDVQSTVRGALEQMTREIREAGYNPAGLPACTPVPVPPACMDAFINATATGFTIQNDWNGNGVIEPAISVLQTLSWGNVQRGERITYSIVGSALQRQESAIDAAAQSLALNVAQVQLGGVPQPYFQFLDANGNVIPTPIANPSVNQSNVRTVVVNLRVGAQQNPPPAWQTGAIQITLSDRVRLRNR